jgi:acyl transferase domain-containing protein
VGDPLEIEAVKRVIKNSGRTSPLYVGSIKSNVSDR